MFNKERSCKDWDKAFAYHKLDHVFEGITLKHLVHHKCTYGNGNMIEEIYEHGDAFELKYEPAQADKLPDYFADPKMTCPSPEEFED